MELQNDVANNSLWRFSTIITPRSGGLNSHHNKGKALMTQPTSKRHQPIIFKQDNSSSHGIFGASDIKGIPNTMESWWHPKNAKSVAKGSSKSNIFDKHFKRKRNNKNYDSWNKAKKRLSTDEINKRRNTSACMNCGEVGHVFNDCPKPKPRLL